MLNRLWSSGSSIYLAFNIYSIIFKRNSNKFDLNEYKYLLIFDRRWAFSACNLWDSHTMLRFLIQGKWVELCRSFDFYHFLSHYSIYSIVCMNIFSLYYYLSEFVFSLYSLIEYILKEIMLRFEVPAQLKMIYQSIAVISPKPAFVQ